MTSWVPRGAVIFCDMNSVIVTLCVILALAMLPAPVVRGVLATAAGSLFEGTPFILAGFAAHALLSRIAGARSGWVAAMTAYLGCGCGHGASARSLPAAVATAMVFGPVVAALRFAAALLAMRVIHSKRHATHTPEALSQLFALLPPALLGGAIVHLFSGARIESVPGAVQAVIGALFGFASSSCALGTVALAASLHARAPFAALGMLCTSGILDVRALHRTDGSAASHDALGYALASTALAIVGLRGGDALVHPRFCAALLLCSLACAAFAVAYRRARSSRARVAPAIMLAGALLGAPPPTYTATETTLTDLFPGERIIFTGTLVHGAEADAIARFAITCCRADAAPVVIRLVQRVHAKPGTWLRVDGAMERVGSDLRLAVNRVESISPPSDPFIYR